MPVSVRHRSSRTRSPWPAWRERCAEACSENREWVISFVVHVVLLCTLWFVHTSNPFDEEMIQLVTVVSPLTPEEIEEQLQKVDLDIEIDELRPDMVQPISLSPDLTEFVGQSLDVAVEAPQETLDARLDSALDAVDEDAFLISLASDLTSMPVGETTIGLQGAIEDAGGDAGSVDRLTIEILRQLEQRDVLVVWLMDASGSLRPRREEIIQRFERVYDELDALAHDRGDRLLTGVVAFGKDVLPMMEPTADRTAIRSAVDSIEPDESGVENVFTALGVAAQHYIKYQKAGRKLMLVVLTDEVGDDGKRLDEAIRLVKRFKVPVYVIGPLAPFGRNQISVKWTDEVTGEVFYLPVQRGPESLQVEFARLMQWQSDPDLSLLSSGFGPYGLTRVARETGGIYFLYDDNSIRGPRFDLDRLWRFAPEYGPTGEYIEAANKSPLRMTVLKTVQRCNETLPQPTMRFLAAGIQFELGDTKETLASAVRLLNQSLVELREAEKQRDRESSARWLAHYDLLMGRMLAARIRCLNCVPLLDEMYARPRVPGDATKNAWELAGDNELTLASGKIPGEGELPADADALRLARTYLRRVVDEYPETPWAELAGAELELPVGFRWQEAFVAPPEGVKLPWDKKPWEELTEAEKRAKQNFDRSREERRAREKKRAEAKKRLPRL